MTIFLDKLASLTANNRRYCMNSASIDFVDDSSVIDSQEAIVAGVR